MCVNSTIHACLYYANLLTQPCNKKGIKILGVRVMCIHYDYYENFFYLTKRVPSVTYYSFPHILFLFTFITLSSFFPCRLSLIFFLSSFLHSLPALQAISRSIKGPGCVGRFLAGTRSCWKQRRRKKKTV